jgi:putative FmdB family regulatory protein
MPLYEYECEACGQRFELIQKFSDGPPESCVKCGKGPVHRQVSSPAFQFKGSGWYITDYARKGSGSEKEGSKSDEAKKADAGASSSTADSGGETKKSDTAAPSAAAAASKPPST